jgi:multidrug/hemolysin transport system permease protein
MKNLHLNILLERNLKLFFRDKSAVLFSLLAIFIIVALYAVFLADVWLSDSLNVVTDIDFLMNSWLLAGLLAVASVTTTMGAFGVMVDDKVRKINKDFHSSPIKKSRITGGYIGSAFIIGVIMTLITLIIAEIYIVCRGGHWLSLEASVKVFLLVLFASISNTSLVCFIVSFFKSHNAFSTAGTIIGTLIGFLTGIYIPIGSLPAPVQTIIKLFSASHAASLFRQVLMEAPMQASFAGVPLNHLLEFKEYMGVTFSFGAWEVTPLVSMAILAGTAVIFYGLALFNISRNK